MPGHAESPDLFTARSLTGYANRQRELIFSDRNEESFHWIAQTQQMFAQNKWRVRHVDYDNAPFGRAVNTPSPYRWWFGGVAWFDHVFTGHPIGLSVERAARWVDPLLQGLLLIGGTAFIAWQFGRWASVLFALGLVALFPLGAEFTPGLPDSHGFAVVSVFVSLLVLAKSMGLLQGAGGAVAEMRVRRWFFVSGLLGGAGIWINVSMQVPILMGVGLGALAAALIARRAGTLLAGGISAPWRMWALGGAMMTFVAYLVENAPDHWGEWRLESIHPLYGLAWLGAGELLTRAVAAIERTTAKLSVRDACVIGLAIVATALIPWLMFKTGSAAFLERDATWLRLTRLPDGVTAASFGAWLLHAGFNATVGAVLLPLGLAVAAGLLIFSARLAVTGRATIALLLGPVVVAAGFAWGALNWWSVLDAVLLVLSVALSAERPANSPRLNPWLWLTPAGLFLIAGFVQLWPRSYGEGPPVLTATEAELLIERDLAHWLARRSRYERAVVYAPPSESTTLGFYGDLRVIGNYCPDNEAALKSTLKIASASSIQEAQLLLQGREVRYLVFPSWDSFFEDYARIYEATNATRWNEFFLSALREWRLPPWLRLLPYETPAIGGLEKQSALVFEIVSDQSPAVAASRLAEALLAIGETERAAHAVPGLRQFPGDVGALAALAQVQFASGDTEGFEQTSALLLKRLPGGGDRYLPWDRRVSLAIVLARAKRADLARLQVQQCLVGLDEKKLGSLSTGSLYNLLGLARSYGLEITDSSVRTWGLQLLPADMRARLQ